VQAWEAASPAEMAAYAAAERVLAQRQAAAAVGTDTRADATTVSDRKPPPSDRRLVNNTEPTRQRGAGTDTMSAPLAHGVMREGGANLPQGSEASPRPIPSAEEDGRDATAVVGGSVAPATQLTNASSTKVGVTADGAVGTVTDATAEDDDNVPTTTATTEAASTAATTSNPADYLSTTVVASSAARIESFCAAVGKILVVGDETTKKLANCLLELSSGCHGDADALARSVSVLRKLVGNLRSHPGDDKYRSVKTQNPKVCVRVCVCVCVCVGGGGGVW
jgi:hypothetical protein